MGPKFLFVMGIVLAHGALGAAWVRQEATEQRGPVPACVNSAAPLPYFQPPRELLAMQVETIAVGDVMQP